MQSRIPVLVIAATTSLGAAGAHAADGEASAARATIRISGHAPLVCRARLDATIVPAAAGETPLGTLSEFCNSPGGYQVFVRGSAALAGATLIVDGRAMPIAADAPTLVGASGGPAIVNRSVSLSAPIGAGGALSFEIVAR